MPAPAPAGFPEGTFLLGAFIVGRVVGGVIGPQDMSEGLQEVFR